MNLYKCKDLEYFQLPASSLLHFLSQLPIKNHYCSDLCHGLVLPISKFHINGILFFCIWRLLLNLDLWDSFMLCDAVTHGFALLCGTLVYDTVTIYSSILLWMDFMFPACWLSGFTWCWPQELLRYIELMAQYIVSIASILSWSSL